ncbi:DUF2513 domain-containing protein [Senimuribacter intestinalis]|uniref:DUF2513 domain-containing protein n=1 Tax=Senimuribacter intestinalis TaxID=2941507 RepID=UPI00353177FE
MRLNPDCIRAILLCVESSQSPEGYYLFRFSSLDDDFLYDEPQDESLLSVNACPELSGFSENEIRYHIKQCHDEGLIDMDTDYVLDNCVVKDLTPYGHEFIAEIRNDNNWTHIKEIAAKIGCTSLEVLSSIASNYISSLLP